MFSSIKPLEFMERKSNSALIFVKPHANSDRTRYLVTTELEMRGFRILTSDAFSGDEINKSKIFDRQFKDLSRNALYRNPNEVILTKDESSLFFQAFKLEWSSAIIHNLILNAAMAANTLALSHNELYDMSLASDKSLYINESLHITRIPRETLKSGDKTEDTKVRTDQKEAHVFKKYSRHKERKKTKNNPVVVEDNPLDYLYLVNGFLGSMKQNYIDSAAVVHVYTVEWNPCTNNIDWKVFLSNVIGGSDPKNAISSSIRGMIYSDWNSLQLSCQPTFRDNCIYASSSAFEAIADRMIWSRNAVLTIDPYASRLLKSCSISLKILQYWLSNPCIEGGRLIFSIMRTKDSDECVQTVEEILIEINREQQKICDTLPPINRTTMALPFAAPTSTPTKDKIFANSALMSKGSTLSSLSSAQPCASSINCGFILIKSSPLISSFDHIVELVHKKFSTAGVSIIGQGKLSAKDIKGRNLVDRQYPKLQKLAVQLTPREYELSEEEKASFMDTFDISWEKALRNGIVLNAKEASEVLQLSSSELSAMWADSCEYIRLSEGFHCARIAFPPPSTELVTEYSLSTESADLDQVDILSRKGVSLAILKHKQESQKDKGQVSMERMDKLVSFEDFLEATDVIGDDDRSMLSQQASSSLIIVNGFYECVKESFESTKSKSCSGALYMVVEWNTDKLSWQTFNADVIGDLDPARAHSVSIRGTLHRHWHEMDILSPPNILFNCIHASSSAFEAMMERLLWVKGAMLYTDALGSKLLAERLKSGFIKHCLCNPRIPVDPVSDVGVRVSEEGGSGMTGQVEERTQSLLDLLKGKNDEECISLLLRYSAVYNRGL